MLILTLLAQQATFTTPPLPPAPPPPPPFSRKVERVARQQGARVLDEFRHCGDARTNSNGRYVEAMGTSAHSSEWNKARFAMGKALTLCRGLRRALRDQEDFLVDLVQSGTSHDAELAARQLDGVSSELQGIEQYYATEAPRYRELVAFGRGLNKDGSDPNRLPAR